MTARVALLAGAALLLAVCCQGNADSSADTPLLCSGNVSVTDCLAEDLRTGVFARLFPGVHSHAWTRVPTRRDGKPLRLYLADSPALTELRQGLETCRAARATTPVWRMERDQTAQGGAIDLSWLRAVAAYPHLVDNVADTDVAVVNLPFVLAMQMWDTKEFRCTRDMFGRTYKGGGPLEWQQFKLAAQDALRRLDVPSGKMFLPLNFWRSGGMARSLITRDASGPPMHSDFGKRGWDNPFGGRFVYVPATPLESLARLVGNCPCAFSQHKDVPFFMISADRDHPVRENLARARWSRFPGSVVEITETSFVNKADWAIRDLSIRYAALMVRSKYCLITSGTSENVRRLFEAVVAGCVPVFLSEWRERRPYSWLHNGTFWDRFSLYIEDYSTLPAIEKGLDKVYATSDEHYALLRAEMRLAVADIIWTFGDPEDKHGNVQFGRAATNTLQEIANRFIK